MARAHPAAVPDLVRAIPAAGRVARARDPVHPGDRQRPQRRQDRPSRRPQPQPRLVLARARAAAAAPSAIAEPRRRASRRRHAAPRRRLYGRALAGELRASRAPFRDRNDSNGLTDRRPREEKGARNRAEPYLGGKRPCCDKSDSSPRDADRRSLGLSPWSRSRPAISAVTGIRFAHREARAASSALQPSPARPAAGADAAGTIRRRPRAPARSAPT